MEIKFHSMETEVFRESCRQTKRVQESAESVVPDTDDDIARIAAVQTWLLLKSKDVSARGVFLSAEACACVLYIAEGLQKVSFVKLCKPFTLEFELPESEQTPEAQVSLSILASEARIVNPRKLSISFDIMGELSCYVREKLACDVEIPEECGQLHLRCATAELTLPNAVTEKTFVLNDQFSFPTGKPRPARLVSQKAELLTGDCQLIGKKLVVKGSVELTLCYLSDEVNYPVTAAFSAPFSQIVDIGKENMSLCCTRTEITGLYLDLVDTIQGEKALDMELHALLQLVCCAKQSVRCIADAYCNSMPRINLTQEEELETVGGIQMLRLSADERVSIPEDCADVLSLFPSLSRLTQEQGKLSAAVILDVVYRTQEGELSAVRRSIALTGECDASARILSANLCDVILRPDGAFVDVHLTLALSCLGLVKQKLERLCGVELLEEEAGTFDRGSSLTMVRAEGESLWELAKAYRSSEEQIRKANPELEEWSGKMLLIPRCP